MFLLRRAGTSAVQQIKNPKQRPTAFVSVHIGNQKIVDQVRELQTQLLRKSASFAPYLQPPESMHVTLMLTAIKKEQLETAKTALEETAAEFKKGTTGGLRLTFKNLGVFNNCVLFAELHEDEEKVKLAKLKGIAKEQFEAHEFPILAEFSDFHPHLTIVKSRVMKLSKEWKEMLNKQIEFGVEDVNALRLCAMGVKPETKDYPVLHEVAL